MNDTTINSFITSVKTLQKKYQIVARVSEADREQLKILDALRDQFIVSTEDLPNELLAAMKELEIVREKMRTLEQSSFNIKLSPKHSLSDDSKPRDLSERAQKAKDTLNTLPGK